MVDYPPERVSNLKAYFIGEDDIKIEFTATGEDLDNGQGNLIYKIFTSYLIYEAVFSHNGFYHLVVNSRSDDHF